MPKYGKFHFLFGPASGRAGGAPDLILQHSCGFAGDANQRKSYRNAFSRRGFNRALQFEIKYRPGGLGSGEPLPVEVSSSV